MSQYLVEQLSLRMKAKNLSITTLEKEAGVKTHAVRNILRERSKKPSAETLQAIADVLGCTIKELLSNPEIFEKGRKVKTKEEIRETKFDHPSLLLEAVLYVSHRLAKKKENLKVRQILTCIEETYLHSLQKDPTAIDVKFADWFIDLTLARK